MTERTWGNSSQKEQKKLPADFEKEAIETAERRREQEQKMRRYAVESAQRDSDFGPSRVRMDAQSPASVIDTASYDDIDHN